MLSPSSLIAFLAPATHLHKFDLALIAMYLLGITLFGLRFREKKGSGAPSGSRSLQSYFLADHSIPWWAISLSIVSAETSTLTIISIPGVAFTGDFAFLQIVFGYLLGRVVVAAIFLPRYFEGNMLTAYQLIDRRFGPTLHKVTAGLFLLTRAAAEGVRVFAISIVVGIAIGTADALSIAIISALTLLYTFEGGMAAVIWTDVVQMGLYLAGTLVAVATLGSHVHGGWYQIASVASGAGKFHLFHFAFNLSQTYTFWAGLLGGSFLTMASHGTDQLMVQRMLAARNLRESRLALLSSGLVILLQFTLFLIIGAGLYVFYGQHPAVFSSPDRIFPTFIVQQMPTGVAGLLVAAILAAAMSNLSAALNSLSSATVVDFYMHARPAANSRERMFVSRFSTVVWALILFAIALYSIRAGGKGHVVETGLSIASVAYGALLGVFLLGTLTRYATQTGAICGMFAGFAFNLLLWLHPGPLHLGWIVLPHIAFTWYVILGSVLTFAVGSAASILLRYRSVRTTLTTAAVLLVWVASGSSQTASFTPATSVYAHEANRVATAQTAAPPQIASCANQSTTGDFSAIGTAVTQAIEEKQLPGAVVLIGHQNQVAFEQAYGKRALEPTGEDMTEDTIFDMASLSKSLVTSVAIMQLAEQGKLHIDDPVVKVLPDFAENGKQDVTIRELLTHYSGLAPDVDIKDSWGLAAPDKSEGIRRALSSPLKAAPGIHFEYSDINFITLGTIVEKLGGQPLQDYAQQHIFLPLHMLHTRYLPFAEACGPKQVFGSAVSLQHPPPSSEPSEKNQTAVSACQGSDWNVKDWITRVAPTAHDDEGTTATNPDFNHILRGTVHDPTTRRMGGVAGHAGLFSDASDLSLYAQALLDRMLHDTGDFPLKQSTLQLMMSPQQPRTAETIATIFTPDGHTTKGVALRGLGWDINSAFSRPRGEIFPIGSFGHTGFTGTSLWIDPTSDSYVILLANAIHPHVGSAISPLRSQVATLAARALGVCPAQVATALAAPADQHGATPSLAKAGSPATLSGIDHLEATKFAALAAIASRHRQSLRLGLLTNQTGVDAMGRRSIDILNTDAPKAVPGLTLQMLFSPEHGISGARDSTDISNSTDPGTHLPVTSLYGPKDSDRRPSHEQLKNLDAVVIDLQDAGVRFYTYETVVGYFLEAAARENALGHNLEIIVLDRPDLIGGDQVQGPVSDSGLESYTDYMPLPVRHGLTLGELARYMNGERRLASPASSNVYTPVAAPLTVVPMLYWNRHEYFDQTQLPWNNPSPNLRSLEASTLYPGVALLETTNVSVGRGTTTPFQGIGASYIEAPKLATYLTSRHIPGVTFLATTMAIAEDANHYPFHGQTIGAVVFRLTDRNLLNAPELGIELIAALHHLYPQQFNLAKTAALIANSDTSQSLDDGQDPRTIAASWNADLETFIKRREPYLLYH